MALAYRSGVPAWNETGSAPRSSTPCSTRPRPSPTQNARREVMERMQRFPWGIGKGGTGDTVCSPTGARIYRHSRRGIIGAEAHPIVEIHVHKLALEA